MPHRSPRVKPRAGRIAVPAPANDTMPLPAEEMGLPALPDMTVEAAAAEVTEEIPETDTEELAAGTAEASVDADADADDEDEEEEERAEGQAESAQKRRADDEPASFLAMYFRDMAELDVLRPEQEFETARNIEQMELDLWRTVLGFAPGTGWILDVVEKELEKPLPEAKLHRAAAERARRKSSIQARARFEKAGSALAGKLRVLDIDRIFIDAALAEIQRVGRATKGLPYEGTIPFSTSTKAFADYVRVVGVKAIKLKAAKNEFVKANLRLVVSIARRFNHGRLPLADLIQEGNIGLMKAVERYDYRRGFRFSTYASWWIRHAISRALADKGRAVRLPVHMIDAYHRIAKSQRELQSKLERPPSTQEIAAATGIEAEKLEKMKTFLSETPVSLDRPISDEDGRRLIDVLVDPNEGPAVPEQMASSETQNEMLKLLSSLKPIEADILRKRFGLVNDRERTLKEIGDEYRLSRERVRQLQEQALGKMRRAMAKRESV
jgi:RNA polymerase primary sigma factor